MLIWIRLMIDACPAFHSAWYLALLRIRIRSDLELLDQVLKYGPRSETLLCRHISLGTVLGNVMDRIWNGLLDAIRNQSYRNRNTAMQHRQVNNI
jgi:hypothetical protein